MQIRVAEEKDAAGIAKVHIDTWRSCYKGIVPESYLSSLNYAEKTKGWAEGLKEGSRPGYVAEIDNQIVGWITFGQSRDIQASDISEIYGVYVLPEYWGANVGPCLFNQAVDNLEEQHFSKITLWVLKKNERAVAFYKKNRFTPDGVSKPIILGGEELTEVRYERTCS